jgi:hypothetical protein
VTKHGFYFEAGLCAYPWRMGHYWREQVSRGMTTIAVNAGGWLMCSDPITALTLQVEEMLEVGLATPGEPLMIWGTPSDVYSAIQRRTRPWPIPVLCFGDDSNSTQTEALSKEVDGAHNMFFRALTTTSGYDFNRGVDVGGSMKSLGSVMDACVIHSTTWQWDTNKNADALGKEVWAYYTLPTRGDYERMRYGAGLWCWAMHPEQFLVWAYVHDKRTMVRPDGIMLIGEDDAHSFVIPKHDGTVVSTPGYDGYEQGIKDCRALEAASLSNNSKVLDYLETVRVSVPFGMPRPGKDIPSLRGEEVIRKLDELLNTR